MTGFPPSYLNFGRHVPLFGDYYSNPPVSEKAEIIPGSREDYAEGLADLGKIFSDVRKRLHQAYERNAKSYNLRKRDLSFKVGDKVWRPNKALSSAVDKFAAKLSPKHILSVVFKKISPLVYVLKNVDGSKAGTWHIKDLLPYRGESLDTESNDGNSVSSEN